MAGKGQICRFFVGRRPGAQCFSVLDEVLGDVCADNVDELENERLEDTPGCRIPAYVAALSARQLVPYELSKRLAHYSVSRPPPSAHNPSQHVGRSLLRISLGL